MAALENIIFTIERWGVLDVLLPFILIFIVIFAILQKTYIFGKDHDNRPRKNLNTMFAIIMGLIVVIPHVLGTYPPDRDVVNIMNSALPNISVIIVAIIMVMIILGIFGKQLEIGDNNLTGIMVLFAFGVVAAIFGDAAKFWSFPNWAWFLRDPETQSAVIIILIFAVIIWFITRDDDQKKDENDKGLSRFFKGTLKNWDK